MKTETTKITATIYIADISPLLDQAVYDRMRILAAEDRRAKADSMKSDKGRAQSLGAGLLLHEACRELAAAGMTGFECADEHISYGEHGKPDFDQKWLEENGFGEMHFSLSHSGDRVMCGISTAPIGCDVEIVKRRDMKIARRFFCEEEYEDIMSQVDDDAKAESFFRYWTLKESVIKCEGRGLGMALDSFSIKLDDKSCIDDATLKEFDLGDGYKYACCVARAGVTILKKQIDLCGLK